MDQLIVERLQVATEQDAKSLGLLLRSLSIKFDGKPVPLQLLEEIVRSPDNEQIVGRLHDRIVGAATLSIVRGIGAGRIGYLQDFVTDPEVRGKGVGRAIWQDIDEWCIDSGVDLEFTSREERAAAHHFYQAQGATIRETSVFKYKPHV